ncbi:UbiA prenyltransferase family protein [Dyadobacter sp. CY261]|uniref:UbiA prenyltransferase family protein n=1 Tax=Dyadobacter sp. CY261 TaxID=2907203 RepID=UPI001F427285|nr:UbiA prenyltransferase family protein [Dyadobacter sp. CY261]MCF0068938.1 UbiA prenyltransferase family protein [Dyadobacter sp. CY261]
MKKIKDYISLLRIHQWVKNTFIFLPAFFGFQITDADVSRQLIFCFFAFSFLASSIYIFNDMLDVESDKLHKTKRNRPLASGAVSKVEGIILMIAVCTLSILIFIFFIPKASVWFFAGVYFVQNILYTIILKHISLIDVVLISLGFVLRIIIGGAASGTILSHWIILMTFVLALFLALAKRRDDVSSYMQTGVKARKNIQGYNLIFLDVSITIMATVVIICYIMYCTSEEVVSRLHPFVYFTSLFVILGVLRYLQLTFVWLISGNPTMVLLKNRFLQVVLLLWILSFAALIYFKDFFSQLFL